jgi:sugar/nucleoside kinase (ribokinase family)
VILVIGDVLLDFFLLPELLAEEQVAGILVRGGGSAANTSVWIAQLGERSRFVGCVGDDSLGRMLRDELEEAGVDARMRTVAGTESGCVAVEATADGERLMRSSRGANAWLAPSDIRSADGGEISWVHLTGYALLGAPGFEILEAAATVARDRGARLSFDPSSTGVIRHLGADRLLSELRECRAWLVLPNESEAEVLIGSGATDDNARGLGGRFPLAIVKQGAWGAVWCDGRHTERVPTEAIRPTDTTGAGDAFNAGVIFGLARGDELVEACALGHSIASRVIRQYGGRPPRGQTESGRNHSKSG